MNLSAPAEDCILLIHRFEERAAAASTSGLARALGVTDSTVTAMVQKLTKLRLVQHKPRKEIALTKQGGALATKLIRRHRLIETYLVQQLGYSWDEVHAEAEQLEHAVSERFVDAIDKKLGFPKIDPHGDPIPDSSGTRVERHLTALHELPAGTGGHVARVYEKSSEALIYLADLGLIPGVKIKLLSAPPHDEIVRFVIHDRELTIGKALAAQIMVELQPGKKERSKA